MDLKILILTSFLCLSAFRAVFAEEPNTQQIQEFLSVHLTFAKNQATYAGVPVSLTLAQGMIESNYGKSELALKANNFFGIKGESGWNGAVFYHKSKEHKENGVVAIEGSKFRQYPDIGACYEDRVNFLWGSSRYNKLFELASNDYIEWAKGLQREGYATDPDYATNIIGFIEKHKLHQYDIYLNKADITLYQLLGNPYAKNNPTDFIKPINRQQQNQFNSPQYINKSVEAIYRSAERELDDMQMQINDLKRSSIATRNLAEAEREAIWEALNMLSEAVAKQAEHVQNIAACQADIERQVQNLYLSDPLAKSFTPTGEWRKGDKIFPLHRPSSDGTVIIAGKRLVQLKSGQTLLDIANANNIEYKNLLAYNDLTAEVVEAESVLPENMYIYLEPKAQTSGDENAVHQVREGENMYIISQLYGIRMSRLYARNLMSMQNGEEPKVGEYIFLNKKATTKPTTRPILASDAPTSLFNAGGGYGTSR